MSWQQALEQADLPLLKRFWENGVAYYQLNRTSLDVLGVGKDLGCDLPGLGVGDLLFVDENTHELWDGQGRVRVVHYRGQMRPCDSTYSGCRQSPAARSKACQAW